MTTLIPIQKKMEVKIDTKKIIIYEQVTDSKSIFFRLLKEDPDQKLVKIYEKENDKFTYFLDGSKSIKEIIFIGYSELPDIISPFGFGFIEKSMTNFFKYKLENSGFEKIYISVTSPETKKSKSTFYFTLEELEQLKSSIFQEQRACNVSQRPSTFKSNRVTIHDFLSYAKTFCIL